MTNIYIFTASWDRTNTGSQGKAIMVEGYDLLGVDMAVRYFNNRSDFSDSPLKVLYRPDTTDAKALVEVVDQKCYEHDLFDFHVLPGEHWLDLGGNIGSFAVFCWIHGATCHSYEPENNCYAILKANMDAIRLLTPPQLRQRFWSFQTAITNSTRPELPFFKGTDPNDHYRASILPPVTQRRVQSLRNTHASLLMGGWKEHTSSKKAQPYSGIKMDIEGSEFGLIESGLVPPADKLVIEYHFSHDRSMRNFRKRVKLLKKLYKEIYYIPSLDQKYPQDTFPEMFDRYIWCKGLKH